MKRSEAVALIINSNYDAEFLSYHKALVILEKLEDAGLVRPTYHIRGKDGLFTIVQGWEPEHVVEVG